MRTSTLRPPLKKQGALIPLPGSSLGVTSPENRLRPDAERVELPAVGDLGVRVDERCEIALTHRSQHHDFPLSMIGLPSAVPDGHRPLDRPCARQHLVKRARQHESLFVGGLALATKTCCSSYRFEPVRVQAFASRSCCPSSWSGRGRPDRQQIQVHQELN
jgi:hypothetical protein